MYGGRSVEGVEHGYSSSQPATRRGKGVKAPRSAPENLIQPFSTLARTTPPPQALNGLKRGYSGVANQPVHSVILSHIGNKSIKR